MGGCCSIVWFIALCAITLLEFSYLLEAKELPCPTMLRAIANLQPVLLPLLDMHPKLGLNPDTTIPLNVFRI